MFLHHFFTLRTSSCFEACGVQRFHSQEFCAWDQFCILPRTKKSVYGIVSYLNFLMSFYITFRKKTGVCGSQVGHIWIALYMWVSGSSG